MTAAAAVSVIVMQKYWHVAPPGLWIVDTSTATTPQKGYLHAARFTAGLAGQMIIIMILAGDP